MIKPRRTKYQWVDSKWVQLFHELREVREKFVVYIYFRYVSRGSSSVLFAYSFLLLFGQFDNMYKVEQDSLYFFS